MKTKILFISHDASRTGAPIVFLHYLNYLNSKKISTDSLILKDGPLIQNFKKIGNVFLWKSPQLNTLGRTKDFLKRKLLKQNDIWQKKLIKTIGPKYDIIYANTVASLNAALAFKEVYPFLKIICHVHEMEMAINQYYGRDNFVNAIKKIDYFIAVSEAVKGNLVKSYGIEASKIDLIYECVPALALSNKNISFSNKSLLERYFNTSPDFLVVGSGSTDWRKGIDYFIETARVFKQKFPHSQVKFLWVGGFKGIDMERALFDIKKLDLTSSIQITGMVDNSDAYLEQCDLFYLTSREDPFPLVALEAGALGKPVICYQGGGGIPEFVTNDRGWTIPYGDVDKACEIIYTSSLQENQASIKQKGVEIQKHVVQNFDIEISASSLHNFLRSITE